MKKSMYTLFFPLKGKDKIILYNTLSGALYLIDDELRQHIEETPDSLPAKMNDDFKKEWILIDDEVNELQTISVMRDEMRFNTSWLQFMIMTTYACNLSCPYCYENKSSPVSMDPSTTRRVCAFMENMMERYRPTHVDVLMYGGEPLLNTAPLQHMVDHFTPLTEERGLEFNVDITTNGTLLSVPQIEALESCRVRVVQVTLDGSQPLHDLTRRYTSGGGTYEDIVSALHLLKESTFKPKIRINVHETNKDSIDVLLDDLKDRGLSDVPIYFGIIRPMSRVCESYSHCIGDAQLESVLPSLWEMALDRGFTIPLKPQSNLIGCGMQGTSSFTIDPQGHLYKCVTMVGYPEQRIGTIGEGGRVPLWNPVYYRWMSRDPLSFDQCRTCPYFPLCGGGCPMIAYAHHGTYDRGGCFETKRVLSQQLALYLQQKYPGRL
jgi:uncharacterized protein